MKFIGVAWYGNRERSINPTPLEYCRCRGAYSSMKLSLTVTVIGGEDGTAHFFLFFFFSYHSAPTSLCLNRGLIITQFEYELELLKRWLVKN